MRDWRGYDRLVVDITSPSETRFPFSLFVSDSKVPIRQGLRHSFAVPSSGFARCVVPLSAFPDNVNRADITTLHFFTTRPPPIWRCTSTADAAQEDERLPPDPPAFLRDVREFRAARLMARPCLAKIEQRLALSVTRLRHDQAI